MIRSFATIMVAVVAVLAGAGQGRAAGDAERGRQVVDKWCALCHAVAGAQQPTAPPFSAIVRRSGRTDAYLRAFLQQDHFPMTTYRLFDHEKEDVLAYFRALRTRP